MDLWALQSNRREAFPEDVSLCSPSSSPAQGHTEGRLQPPLPSRLSLPSLIQPPALPSPAQEATTNPLLILQAKEDQNLPFSKEHHQRNPSVPLGQLTWLPWNTKITSPIIIIIIITLCPLCCRPSFSHTMNELIMPTNSSHYSYEWDCRFIKCPI